MQGGASGNGFRGQYKNLPPADFSHFTIQDSCYPERFIMKNQADYLKRFIKDECSNFDRHYQICLLDDERCGVLFGRRCGYFEKAVLGSADYKYRLPDFDYGKLFAQYAEQTRTVALAIEQRRCACGNPLGLRQRFCVACSQKRRKDSNQKSQNKHRVLERTTVSS